MRTLEDSTGSRDRYIVGPLLEPRTLSNQCRSIRQLMTIVHH